jgi:uncharacterized protein YcaQ
MTVLRADQARRIALAAQGFDRPRPSGRIDIRHVRLVIDHVDLLQIDAVQTIERAQYVPLFSRLGNYPRALLDDAAYRRRELFEAWAHEACLVSVERWPLLQYRRNHWASRRARRLEREQPDFLAAVLDEVAKRGPLTVRDLPAPGERTGPWWGWSPGKTALEALFARGDLGIAYRNGQTRVYDLAERVIPPEIFTQPLADTPTAYLGLLCIAARAMGVATADDLIDYYRLHAPTARPLLAALVSAGRLEQVDVEGWPPAYRWPDARLPRRVDAAALLAPFDPLVWYRPRVERLFGFHYRLEFYVPAGQREYGYYVMPFLLGDQLVARVDVKADRRNGVLRVLAAFVEDGHDPSRIVGPLRCELRELADWIGVADVQVDDRGSLGPSLAAARPPAPATSR